MKSKIKEAWRKGKLTVRSVSPCGEMEWKPLLFVLRHDGKEKTLINLETSQGSLKVTEDHKIFISPTEKKSASEISVGDSLLSVREESVSTEKVLSKSVEKESPQYVYDLTVVDYHNFQTHRSKVVVSNSPDRHYHFRPPEHEGVIQNFNRVFGQIWQDYELLEYLKLGLDWWNMYPPETEYLCSLDQLMQIKPTWRTAVLWAAMVHALTALAINWISEEFSIAGETEISVVLKDGSSVTIPIKELYEIVKGESMWKTTLDF